MRVSVLIAILLLVGCGSKKKTTEITKEERKEKKDLSVFTQKDVLSVITFTKDATELIIEPINPAIPIKINDSTVIHNAKVVISTKKTDSTVINRDSSTIKVIDKGEVKERKKEKNQYKEKQIQILWWQWIILIVGFFLIGLWVYFRATGKRIRFW